ncbi:MAG: 50S ribosomal protein L3 [Candidatus Omnitrophica bacterium]|nr:50S ribosomal protein L3 [Candidatus Omnitrophota bacterium]
MAIGLLGKKIGMTEIFDKLGRCVPATVLEVGPCHVRAIKTKEKDGYSAVQIGFGEKTRGSLRKPVEGQFKKVNIEPRRFLREIRTEQIEGLTVGQELKVDLFRARDFVDISGQTVGRGFQGVVKRHRFKGGPRSHGASMNGRKPGSIGSNTYPGHTLRGLRMAGHMGTNLVTQQNIRILDIIPEENLMVVKGSVVGHENGLLVIRNARKRTDPNRKWEILEALPEEEVKHVAAKVEKKDTPAGKAKAATEKKPAQEKKAKK